MYICKYVYVYMYMYIYLHTEIDIVYTYVILIYFASTVHLHSKCGSQDPRLITQIGTLSL